ncbi:hypothetical protein GYMLUDRAFT_42215 [Collybiopsis luxurians FD-317 M1]|uniref:Thioredoxin domain-containing protein n=1 Tax=Collybiopsis luxurians FD-317 M1 TaxID=944289 RepID=A0A0D0BEQ7_9AGAR|nr:hypothetical protein GYMLUDRAFT_42215 [Collybiopsis luxurians FD-317 M1]
MSEPNLLDGDTLNKAFSLEVTDVTGKKVNFGSLFKEKTIIVVFIRHFFCGNCQLYVSHLNSECQQLASSMQEGNTDIIVVGCGQWEPIEKYSELTGFPSSRIFADPDLNVFHALGMNIRTLARTPTGKKRASYLTDGIIKTTILSTWRAFMSPKLLGKQGNVAQLGGEFIFGPGNQCTFAHRMQHTEDHVEISLLLEKAGLRQNVGNVNQ